MRVSHAVGNCLPGGKKLLLRAGNETGGQCEPAASQPNPVEKSARPYDPAHSSGYIMGRCALAKSVSAAGNTKSEPKGFRIVCMELCLAASIPNSPGDRRGSLGTTLRL